MIARLLLISFILSTLFGCSPLHNLTNVNANLDRKIRRLAADNKKLSAANASLLREKGISDKLMLNASKELSGKDLEIMKLKNRPPKVVTEYRTNTVYYKDTNEINKLNERIALKNTYIDSSISSLSSQGECKTNTETWGEERQCNRDFRIEARYLLEEAKKV